MNMILHRFASAAPLLCALLAASAAFSQGSLVPPGPPGPAMKTLDQIEPRVDLQATPPAAGVVITDENYHFVITQPGSYYLSANLAVTRANGILIEAAGVSLDLGGFKVLRSAGTGGIGINIVGTAHRATVRNGSVRGFASGVQTSLTPSIGYAPGVSVREVAVSHCSTIGISTGNGGLVESCRLTDLTGAAGIFVLDGSRIANCVVTRSTLNYGIFTGEGSSLTDCTVSHTTGLYGYFVGYGSNLTGCTAARNTVHYAIYTDGGSTLSHCTASYNTGAAVDFTSGFWVGPGSRITDCLAAWNMSQGTAPTSGMGFYLSNGSTIQNCSAVGNRGDGIRLTIGCLALENACDLNGSGGGNGAGIHANSNRNRIEGNLVTRNTRGISVSAGSNYIVRNSASGNSTNWEIANGNVIFVLNAAKAGAFSGDSGGVSPGTTNPHANFTY